MHEISLDNLLTATFDIVASHKQSCSHSDIPIIIGYIPFPYAFKTFWRSES
jgi:hypothetical protein